MQKCMKTETNHGGLDWSLLRSFAAVMRLGTLSAAAQAIGQTQPTVGRHIRTLEAEIGEPLFERRGSLLTPTARAAALYERASAMEEAAFAVARDIAGGRETLTGTVRLSVPEVFGSHAIPAMLARFQQQWPDVAVELVANNAADDLLRREADIAVRLFRPRQPDLVMAMAGKVHVGLFASHDYIRRNGRPEVIGDFFRHRLIGEDQGDRILKAMRDFGMPITRESFHYRTDSILAQIAAVEAGVGLGAGLTLAFDMSKVERVLAAAINIPFDVHVVAHGDLHRNRRMRALFDHLVAELRSGL
jgi:DNA-binding transcriptional LysR family regulator